MMTGARQDATEMMGGGTDGVDQRAAARKLAGEAHDSGQGGVTPLPAGMPGDSILGCPF
jgi:hypothetical protein